MRFANRLLLLSTVAALDGLAISHEALAGCLPSPTPGDDTITCSAIIPPPIIPFLDLSNGGRDRVTILSGTILGNVTFSNNQPSSLTMNNGLIGGSTSRSPGHPSALTRPGLRMASASKAFRSVLSPAIAVPHGAPRSR